MSAFSDGGNASLGDIISYLEALPQDALVAKGFGRPHSYRGYYEDLAFEPMPNVTVADMLAAAKSAVGRTFHGWKGGEYTMSYTTDCWLADRGSCGVPIVCPDTETAYVLPTMESLQAEDAVAR